MSSLTRSSRLRSGLTSLSVAGLKPSITNPYRAARLDYAASIYSAQARTFHACHKYSEADYSRPRRTDDRPRSDETTQTDFGEMDVLGNIPPPASSIESCMTDGFVLSNGVSIQNSGMLLVGGEVFRWTPWNRKGTINQPQSLARLGGQVHISQESWGILELIWPKPDLLVVGTGKSIKPLSPETRKIISSMGIRVEVLDTRNAASQYNLLATERGVHEIAAAIVPIGVD